MTREDIIRMAREAGAMLDHMTWVERGLAPVFERFAALVAGKSIEGCYAEMLAQVAAEREACAKVCDDLSAHYWDKDDAIESMSCEECATAIRSRGQQ